MASESAAAQDESYGWQTVFEFVYLFLHIADRLAFQVIGSENRSSFMDDLASMTFHTTAEVFLRKPDDKLDRELKASLVASLNRRNTEYGSYQKLFPVGDDGFKGTLFWEFGKRIAETRRRPKDIGVMMTASSVALAALQLLQLKDALQRTLE
jgi:hypothetical protein